MLSTNTNFLGSPTVSLTTILHFYFFHNNVISVVNVSLVKSAIAIIILHIKVHKSIVYHHQGFCLFHFSSCGYRMVVAQLQYFMLSEIVSKSGINSGKLYLPLVWVTQGTIFSYSRQKLNGGRDEKRKNLQQILSLGVSYPTIISTWNW